MTYNSGRERRVGRAIMTATYTPSAEVLASGMATIPGLFRARARVDPTAPAVEDGERRLSYAELDARVDRLAQGLVGLGVGRGGRVALLTRNCLEYLEVELAVGRLGAITAAQNWRLADRELAHCLDLVAPEVIILAPEFLATLDRLDVPPARRVVLGEDYERLIATSPERAPEIQVDPEDGLVILYTSGTTGLPKGAMISHRAMVARAMVYGSELQVPADNVFLAWAPFYHMASTDHGLATLLRGGTVAVLDGYQPGRIIEYALTRPLYWLILIPGMIEPFIGEIRHLGARFDHVHMIGAMADLVPRHQLAEITGLLGAGYFNSFGSTETGIPPATRTLTPIGEAPTSLAKRQSPFCEVRLVDGEDNDVAPGAPGEVAIKGPTLFSGYWNAEETNARDFRGGWFHMGDVMRRNPDGTLDFIDRVKYMIKSGGENVYPAEIEQVIMGDARIDDVAVVRKADARWGEVPVAFIARKDATLDEAAILARCGENLAGYKRPKEVHFIAFDDFPRSTSGKIQRHALEARLAGNDGTG